MNKREWNAWFRTGLAIGFAVGVYAVCLYDPKPFDGAIERAAEPIIHPQPKNISYGDYLFGCRKPTDCPTTR